jgi:hypothetical protein
MPTIEERLDRWERRQEDLIATLSDLTDVVEIISTSVAELKAWLMQPPPASDLPDLIRALNGALDRLGDRVEQHGAQLTALRRDLPAQVARAVTTGECA